MRRVPPVTAPGGTGCDRHNPGRRVRITLRIRFDADLAFGCCGFAFSVNRHAHHQSDYRQQKDPDNRRSHPRGAHESPIPERRPFPPIGRHGGDHRDEKQGHEQRTGDLEELTREKRHGRKRHGPDPPSPESPESLLRGWHPLWNRGRVHLSGTSRCGCLHPEAGPQLEGGFESGKSIQSRRDRASIAGIFDCLIICPGPAGEARGREHQKPENRCRESGRNKTPTEAGDD